MSAGTDWWVVDIACIIFE